VSIYGGFLKPLTVIYISFPTHTSDVNVIKNSDVDIISISPFGLVMVSL